MDKVREVLKRYGDVEKLIEHIEWLCRIKLSETEREDVKKNIPRILEFFNEMDEIDTSQVEPLTHPVEVHNVLREDVVEEGLTQDEALKNASERENGYFKAPRIV